MIAINFLSKIVLGRHTTFLGIYLEIKLLCHKLGELDVSWTDNFTSGCFIFTVTGAMFKVGSHPSQHWIWLVFQKL